MDGASVGESLVNIRQVTQQNKSPETKKESIRVAVNSEYTRGKTEGWFLLKAKTCGKVMFMPEYSCAYCDVSVPETPRWKWDDVAKEWRDTSPTFWESANIGQNQQRPATKYWNNERKEVYCSSDHSLLMHEYHRKGAAL